MTEYQGYPSKQAADMAAIQDAVAEIADLSPKPIYFAENIKVGWRDPSPISAAEMADDLAKMRDIMAEHNRFAQRTLQSERYYSNAWVARYMEDIKPPRDRAILDSFPLT